MEQNLGKLILLKKDLKRYFEEKNFKEAENILKLINIEYKKLGRNGLKDVLDSNQIEKIEECFGKKIDDLLNDANFKIESK